MVELYLSEHNYGMAETDAAVTIKLERLLAMYTKT